MCPTRADEVTSGPTDFVDFVRNIGQPPDKKFGGGYMATEKGAFFLASLAHVVLVHTRTRKVKGKGRESRFIVAGLSDHGKEKVAGKMTKLTGRHWWGRMEGGVVEPVTGDDADEIADALGVPRCRSGETGTTISIVAPDLSVEADSGAGTSDENLDTRQDPGGAFSVMARAIGWHFWPKLSGRDPSMEVMLELDGEAVAIPDGATDARLDAFESAKSVLDGEKPHSGTLRSKKEEIWSERPRKLLGHLAIVMHPIFGRDLPDSLLAAPEATGTLHHAALMRQAELVVKYVAGPEVPLASAGYAAAFRCTVELDQVFRDAEPPSHDDWIADHLQDAWHQRYVRVAQTRIGEKLAEFAEGAAPDIHESETVPLGAFARQLGDLMPGVGGPGGSRTSTKSSPSTSNKPLLQVQEPAHLVRDNGDSFVEATVRSKRKLEVSALPVVAAGEGVEREAPADAAVPVVLFWRSETGDRLDGSRVTLPPNVDWTVRVSSVSDAVVRIDFEAE